MNPKKSSNKKKNSNQSAKGKGGQGQGQGRQGQGRKRKGRKKPKLDPVKYWGDPGSLPVRSDYQLESQDPTGVIRSLGKAPIPGKNSAPELYFEVLYSRAAGLAQALSFAGGLNQSDASQVHEDEPALSDEIAPD